MIKVLKKLIFQMVAGANIATIIVMLVMGYADRLSPITFPLFACLGLMLPVILLVNLGFLLFWTFFKIKNIWIPILGFILCFQPIRNYIPFNLTSRPPKSAIKVLSYNVWYFSSWNYADKPNPIYTYIKAQNADIVCLQESQTYGNETEKKEQALNTLYRYHAQSWKDSNTDQMDIYSKYPIIKQENIKYQSNGNHSTAFYLNIHGDTVIVINNHFESIGLSDQDKADFKLIIKGKANKNEAKVGSKSLLRKLTKAAKIRAKQTEAVARFIQENKDKSIIVCGDFNDSPNSYAHRTIAKNLQDCYITTGNGTGISYHVGGFYVRIDHILCSKNFVPYNCKVDNSIDISDHYPIYCWLEKIQDKRKKNN